MSDRVEKLMLPPDDPDDVYPEVYSMSRGDDGDDGGEGGGETYDPTDGDEGAEESESADIATDADEVVEADGVAGADGAVDADGVVDVDGAAGGRSAGVDAGRRVDGDAGGDAICFAPDGEGDDADEAAGAASAMTRPVGAGSSRRRDPAESMEYLKLPNTRSVGSDMLAKNGRRAGGCGVNSKEPKEIGLTRGDVDEVGELADASPTTSRVPTVGTICRGGLSAMPSVRGLGLEESCELAKDIGKSNKRNKGFTQLQALDRGNPTCCLSDLFIWKIFGLQWGVDLVEGKIDRVW